MQSLKKIHAWAQMQVPLYIWRVLLLEAIGVINKNHQNIRQIREKQFLIQLTSSESHKPYFD